MDEKEGSKSASSRHQNSFWVYKVSNFGVKSVAVELQKEEVLDGDSYMAEGSLCEVGRKLLLGEREWWKFGAVV